MRAVRTSACSVIKKLSAVSRLRRRETVEQQLERYLQWIKPGPFNESGFSRRLVYQICQSTCRPELFRPVDKLLAEGVIGSVRLSTRPDYIDAARLELLQAHGVKR